MHRYLLLAGNPAVLLLIATAILLVAWPLQNVPALAVAAVMILVAAGMAVWAHFSRRETPLSQAL